MKGYDFFNFDRVSFDVITGTLLAVINDWSIIFANVGIVVVRVLLEYFLLRANPELKRKKKR